MSGALRAAVEHERDGFRLRAELACEPGEVAAVVGPSGAGKTTLLRCLAGLEPRCRGTIEVAGEVWQESGSGRFVPPHRRRVGMVFQEGRLFPHLSVRGNLEYGWRRWGRERSGMVGRAHPTGGGVSGGVGSAHHPLLLPEEVAAELHLSALLDRGVEDLSGGERQRVALARALLAAPAVLLLDEPLASVDPAGRAALGAALLDACRAMAVPVVLVTHSRAEVLRLADRVSVLQRGEVTASGAVAAMATALAAVPPEAGEDVAALVRARVARHDEDDALTYLEFEGGTFAVPRLRAEVGAHHRLLVQARDVSVALARPVGTSILNVYPARVVEVEQGEDGQPLLRLAVGETLLLARLTRRSLRELALVPGQEVFAQVKAVALA